MVEMEKTEEKKKGVYILNTPVLTSYGTYNFRKCSVEEAKQLLEKGDFVSAVGHEATSRIMTELLGVKIPTQRCQIKMEPGDKALVFRLKERLPEGKVLTEEEMRAVQYELGQLEREE